MAENETSLMEPKHKPWRKLSFRLLLVASVLLVILVAIYFVYSGVKNMTGTFTDYAVINSMERSDGTSTKYTLYDGAVLKYSRDGATAYDADGEIRWSGSYEMNDPIVDVCDTYAVIANRGGTSVQIFNKSGTLNAIVTNYPIQKVQIANQGVVAILMEDTDSSYIVFYNGETGAELVNMKVSYERSGYGIDISLSNDGQKLVTSFLDVNGGVLKTNVAYYNFGEVGETYKDHLTLGSIYNNLIIPKVEFLNNDIICVYRDDGFELYEMEQTPSKNALANVTFEQQILSAFASDAYVGFVIEPSEEEEAKRIVAYDLSGKKVLDKKININYTSVSMSGSDIIFMDDSQCMILNVNGRIRFEHTFTSGCDGVFGTSVSNRYFLMNDDSIDLIKLKGAK